MARKTKKDLENEVAMLNDALEMSLAVSPVRDNNFFGGTGGLSELYEGRSAWDRKKIFAESLRAWRVNPLARRIVKLITAYVVGKNLKIKSTDPAVQNFLDKWFVKNDMRRNLKRWKDEDTRTGNLFPLFNVLENKMTIIRMVPAEQIEEIKTAENDIEQELEYWQDSTGEKKWTAYQPDKDQKQFMLHFASNQTVGSPWGEADLSPLLVWIGRYSSWLEDRVRLNRFRTAFMYVVSGSYKSEADRIAREKELRSNPPQPGSVLVVNDNNGESWGTLSANLDAFDASVDGLSIKKMLASGVGFPLHWLAEPESSTRTTAEAAGTPSFRTLEETQSDFFEVIISMARVALQVAGLNHEADISIEGSDITERDNATIGLAFARAFPALSELYDRDAIEPDEFMRLAYKMLAEVYEDKSPDIKKKPLVKQNETNAPSDSETDETDPQEGDDNA